MPLFISHSSTDRRVAEQIVTRLRAEGFASLFLDIDPVQGIPAGRNWERELYAALRRTDGVIFLASRTSVSSPWCFAEVSLARSLDKPVFPVHLEDTPRLALLSDVQWVNLTDREVGFASLLAGLRRAGLSAGDAFAWDPFRPPYPGLEPFSSEDAAVFFGRDGEISRLLELLHPTLQRGPGRFVAIVGPSGSGKSSLLRAGLLPRLQRLGGRWVLLPPLRPGEQPTRNLARCLVEAFVGLGQPRALKDVDQYLHRGSVGLRELALELAELTAEPGARQPAVLIVIDQAEELLTRTGPREQQAFLQLLVEALGEESPLWAVATVRSEFLSTAPERAGLADAVDDPLVVEPLSRARLPDVIGRPGQRAGLTFEPGLVERMVEDTAGGDALPLLAFSLRELYDHSHTAEGNIRFADYEALGGVLGALEQQADRLLDELTRRGRGPLILPTLLKLVSVGHEGEAIRRRVFRSSLSADEQLVVDAFIDARLLTSDSGGGGDVSVEVAHEALLRQWSPLRQAIEDSRRSLQMRSELDRLATDWDRRETGKGRSYEESYLLHGGRLDDFRKWANDHPDEMDPIKLEYLRVSRALHDRRLRQLRGLSAGLAVLLIGALIAGTAAILQANKAQAAAHLAMSRQLAVVANQLVDRQPDVAVLVGLESLSAAQGETVLPAAGLITGLARMNNSSRLLEVSNRAYDASFSPDGELLATSGDNGMVQLWNADTGRPHGSPLSGHQGGVSRVEFSPDGRLLASAGDDGTVRLWDVASGQPSREPISAQAGMVYDVAFNRTGELLATSNLDGTVRLCGTWPPVNRTVSRSPVAPMA